MKKIILLLFSIITLLILSSCSYSTELSSLALATAIAIDKSGDEIEVSALILNHSAISGNAGSEQSTILLSSTGESIVDALSKFKMKLQRELFLDHVNLLLIDENLAKDGINTYLDYFMRADDTRSKVNLAIAKEVSAKEVLSIILPIEFNSNTKGINTIKEISTKTGLTTDVRAIDFIQNFNISGKENVIPTITVTGNVSNGSTNSNLESSAIETYPEYIGLSVFKEDILLDYLDESEAVNYNFLIDEISSAYLTVPCSDENNFDIKINKSKSNMQVSSKSSRIVAYIDLDIEAEVINIGCKDIPQSFTDIKKFEIQAKKFLQENLEDTANRIQTVLKSDVLGIGEYIYRNEYKKWITIKDDWDELFSDVEIMISTNLVIKKI